MAVANQTGILLFPVGIRQLGILARYSYCANSFSVPSTRAPPDRQTGYDAIYHHRSYHFVTWGIRNRGLTECYLTVGTKKAHKL